MRSFFSSPFRAVTMSLFGFFMLAGTLPAHSLKICKVSDPAAPVTGNFTFSITGTTYTATVPVGGCSVDFYLDPGDYTIVEAATAGTKLSFVGVVPASLGVAIDYANRTVVARVASNTTTVVSFTNSQNPGNQGCSPGYYKNHLSSFTSPYTPDRLLGTVFTSLSGTPFASVSLLDALQGNGGPDLAGAEEILLRAAVAAVLNAANPNVSYPLSVPQIVTLVNQAILSGDRSKILELARVLDNYNNGPGGCPLS